MDMKVLFSILHNLEKSRTIGMLFFLCCALTSVAQTVVIKGTVVDDKKEPVELATVSAPKGPPCKVLTMVNNNKVEAAR